MKTSASLSPRGYSGYIKWHRKGYIGREGREGEIKRERGHMKGTDDVIFKINSVTGVILFFLIDCFVTVDNQDWMVWARCCETVLHSFRVIRIIIHLLFLLFNQYSPNANRPKELVTGKNVSVHAVSMGHLNAASNQLSPPRSHSSSPYFVFFTHTHSDRLPPSLKYSIPHHPTTPQHPLYLKLSSDQTSLPPNVINPERCLLTKLHHNLMVIKIIWCQINRSYLVRH